MSILTQKLTRLSLITTFIGVSSLTTSELAQAYSIAPVTNGDFNSFTTLDGSNGWTGLGSTDISGSYTGDNVSFDGSNQGIITTACPASGTFCGSRDDDPNSATPYTFNLRGQDQLSASPEVATLQTGLNLSAEAFSINRVIDGIIYNGGSGAGEASPALYRTAKEGSAIFQDITINNDGDVTDTRITFNWDFLTNDTAGALGDKDFGFISISGNGFEQVIPLESSTGMGPLNNDDNYNFSVPTDGSAPGLYDNSLFINDFSLSPGTYRVGLGVIDIDGSGASSALLVDGFMVEEVPFEFSPTAGIGLVLGFLGWRKFRSRQLDA